MTLPKLTGKVWAKGAWRDPATWTPPAPGGAHDLRATMRPDLPRFRTVIITPTSGLAALDQAITDRASQPATGQLIEVICQPGTYLNSYPGPASMLYVRSATGIPGDVVFASDATSGGVWHWWGGYTWAEGITLRSLTPADSGQTGAKYPLHAIGGGSLVFIDCAFEAASAQSDGGDYVMGWDGGSGGTYVFIGCHFEDLGGGAAGFNVHGPDAPLGRTVLLYNCTAPAPSQFVYSSWDSPLSRVYCIGGNIALGTMGGGATGHTSGFSVPRGGIAPYWRIRLGIS